MHHENILACVVGRAIQNWMLSNIFHVMSNAQFDAYTVSWKRISSFTVEIDWLSIIEISMMTERELKPVANNII